MKSPHRLPKLRCWICGGATISHNMSAAGAVEIRAGRRCRCEAPPTADQLTSSRMLRRRPSTRPAAGTNTVLVRPSVSYGGCVSESAERPDAIAGCPSRMRYAYLYQLYMCQQHITITSTLKWHAVLTRTNGQTDRRKRSLCMCLDFLRQEYY